MSIKLFSSFFCLKFLHLNFVLNCRKYFFFLKKKQKGSFFCITIFKVLEKDFNVNHLSEYVIHGHDEINLLGGVEEQSKDILFFLSICVIDF